ncbi:MAG TPA: hypothetical protein VIU40_11415 [Geobacteraceae bacterium]
MGMLLRAVVLVVLLGSATAGWGMTPYVGEEELKAEVQRGVEQTLDLWRDGRYDELYHHTVTTGTQTKEQFVKALAAAPLRPVCCWDKIRDVRVSLKGDSAATVKATLGFEGGGGTEYKTRPFKLVKEDGVWRMQQKDILAFAEAKTQTRKKNKNRTHLTY